MLIKSISNILEPDIIPPQVYSAPGVFLPGVTRNNLFYRASKLNQLGYIPVVSTFTGLARTIMALVYTIYHLVKAIFGKESKKADHWDEFDIGTKHIKRGLGEMIPFIGLFVYQRLDNERIAYKNSMLQSILPGMGL